MINLKGTVTDNTNLHVYFHIENAIPAFLSSGSIEKPVPLGSMLIITWNGRKAKNKNGTKLYLRPMVSRANVKNRLNPK